MWNSAVELAVQEEVVRQKAGRIDVGALAPLAKSDDVTAPGDELALGVHTAP